MRQGPRDAQLATAVQKDGTEQHEEFRRKVTYLAKQISVWAKQMKVEDYNGLLDVDEIAEKRGELKMLIHNALIKPTGKSEAIANVSEMKTILDSFELNINQYIEEVSQQIGRHGITELSIIEDLQNLEKKLNNWCNDE